jgi:hypothetical protein
MIRFTKETFPKKYCIKVTEENVEVLRYWRTVLCNAEELINSYLLSIYQDAIGFAVQTLDSNFTEITFEEFRKFVLNEEIEEQITIKDKNMKYLIKFLNKLGIK